MTNKQRTERLTDEELEDLICELEAAGFYRRQLIGLAELQERRKADSAEPVAYWRYAFRADGFCYADGINSKKHHDAHPLSQLSDGDYWRVTPLYTAPQPVNDAERAELQEHRKADSQAQATLNLLAVILHGSEVDLNLLTVTAQSLMDRCKAATSSDL